MVTGFLLSSHGFMGVILNYAIIGIMNPENKPASEKVMEGNQK